jgi:sugar phosphate isomerase/epimerase
MWWSMAGKYSFTNKVLFSTDSLNGYGLDLVFSVAKDAGCDGIDLALWKNFDAWHDSYVKKLCEQYKLPVEIVQTSPKVNAKELNQAVTICQQTGAKHISINAPSYFDVKTFTFLTNNLSTYQKQYPDITFSIINPDTASMAYLPFPKYRFKNIGEIIKKHKCKLWFDISAMDEEYVETMMMTKMSELASYISVCYVSDRKKEHYHILPWDGTYNLPSLLKNMAKNKYIGFFSMKLQFDPQTLVNNEKVLFQIKKSLQYIDEYFHS